MNKKVHKYVKMRINNHANKQKKKIKLKGKMEKRKKEN